jgi:hypothetical protein
MMACGRQLQHVQLLLFIMYTLSYMSRHMPDLSFSTH